MVEEEKERAGEEEECELREGEEGEFDFCGVVGGGEVVGCLPEGGGEGCGGGVHGDVDGVRLD